MDAKLLYREGVLAIRDQKDIARGRDLLIQSLREDPSNDMAWLWLTRTVADRQKRLEYVERALKINPANEQALKLKERLQATPPAPPSEPSPEAAPAPPTVAPVPETKASAARAVIRPIGPKTVDIPVTQSEKAQIAQLMEKADIYLESGDEEAAVAQWVEVLKLRVDHEVALRNAAGHLWRMRYWDDAEELVQRALDAGTQVPSIYLTAIDMAERRGDQGEAGMLREKIATLPAADEQLLVSVADYYLARHQTDQALHFLEQAIEAHPKGQKLLVKLGDVYQELDRKQEAMVYYDRAVRLGTRSRQGKEADKKLAGFVPVLTDRERGSVWLAVRETVGVTLLFLLLGWQDAGLSLLSMGPRRWVGVLLSMVGGYLLVTATSSPQQDPVASWLGGHVPATAAGEDALQPVPAAPGRAAQDPTHLPIVPESARYLLGTAGIVLLVMAFILVFYHALDLLRNNPVPYRP
jgi:tetratricopeptide (TPR) repeat protein